MNADDLKTRLMNTVFQRAETIITNRALTLKALLKYEIAVTNTELALYSNDHGYDFKFLSDSYADNVVISPVQTSSNAVSLRVTIPQYAFKNASDKEISFFKEYVLANALRKLKHTNRGDFNA